jgi:hypothetical protein
MNSEIEKIFLQITPYFITKLDFFVWLTPVNKIIKNDGNLTNILTGYVVKFGQTTFNKVVRTRETGELEVGFVC